MKMKSIVSSVAAFALMASSVVGELPQVFTAAYAEEVTLDYYYCTFDNEVIEMEVKLDEESGDLYCWTSVPVGIPDDTIWGELTSTYAGVKLYKFTIDTSKGTSDDFSYSITMSTIGIFGDNFSWDHNYMNGDRSTFDFITDVQYDIPDSNYVRSLDLNVHLNSSAIERLGLKEGDTFTVTLNSTKPIVPATELYNYEVKDQIIQMKVQRNTEGSLYVAHSTDIHLPGINLSWNNDETSTWGKVRSTYAGVKCNEFVINPPIGSADDFNVWISMMAGEDENGEPCWFGGILNGDYFTLDFAADVYPFNNLQDDDPVYSIQLNISMKQKAITELGLDEGDTFTIIISDDPDKTVALGTDYYTPSLDPEPIEVTLKYNVNEEAGYSYWDTGASIDVDIPDLDTMTWAELMSMYAGAKFDEFSVVSSIGTPDDFDMSISLMTYGEYWDNWTWNDNYGNSNQYTFDFISDGSGIPLENYIFFFCLNVFMKDSSRERLGLEDGDTFTITIEFFDNKNEVTSTITPDEGSDKVPDEDKIPSVTINPGANITIKGSEAEIDLSQITLKVKEIFEESALQKAYDALGSDIDKNSHVNVLDMSLLYNNEDISEDYDGLVKVIIPLPENHRDKTFSCYRLTEVDGKMVKEVIPGEQTEDSYIVYLEHFSEYALVGKGEGEDDNSDDTVTTTPAPEFYKIDLKTDGHGKASANVEDTEKVEAGTEVTLTAAPDSGYKFSKWAVIKGGVAIKDNKFTMPESDVEIKAEFEKTTEPDEPTTTTPELEFYKIDLKTDGHGKASASVENPEKVEAGTEVTLTATPDSGYRFSKWTVIKGGVTIKDNKFTMPESDVEIKAEFTKTSSSGSSGGSSGGGGSSGSSRRPSSTSSSTDSATVTVNGKSGSWADVVTTINSAANGGTITISGSTDIPADVIAAAAKKNIKLEVKVNDTFTWVIEAAKAGEGAKSLSVTDTAITATNKTIKSGESSKDFRVTESKLGTGASLRYNAGKANSGKFANLFRVNGTALEFVAVVKVDAAGNALLPVTAAGTYKIVISGETKLVGDLDNSMGLNALDAAVMLKKLVDGDVSADETAKFDFNGDGRANALDAAAILKWVVNN